MIRLFQYYFIGTIFLLLSLVTTKDHTSHKEEKKTPEYTYVSQQQIDYNKIQLLSFLYSHTPREITASPLAQDSNGNKSFKYTLLFSLITNIDKQTCKQIARVNYFLYSCLHPNPIGYYIYTLRRIII